MDSHHFFPVFQTQLNGNMKMIAFIGFKGLVIV